MAEFSHLTNALRQVSSAVVGKFDLDDLLQSVVLQCREVCAADICSIYLLNEDKTKAVERASVGYWHELRHAATYDLCVDPQQPRIGLTAWSILTARKFVANSRAELERHPAWTGRWDEQHFGPGYQCTSLLIVPLKVADQVLGVLKIENKKPSPGEQGHAFTAEEQATLEILANTVALAIHLTELSQQRRRDEAIQISAALQELVRNLAGPDTLKAVLTRIVRTLREKTHARATAIFLVDRSSSRLRLAAHDNYIDEAEYDLTASSNAPRIGMTTWVVLTKRRFVARTQQELESHPAYWGKYKGQTFNGDPSCSSWIGIPLLVDHECLGLLRLEAGGLAGDHSHPYFTEQEENFADFMAVLTTSALRIAEALRLQQAERERFLNLQQAERERYLTLDYLGRLMRAQDDPQRIAFILLTGLTHGQGLGFNRAIYCDCDCRRKRLKGEMAVGPANRQEAERMRQAPASTLTSYTIERCLEVFDKRGAPPDVELNRIVRTWNIDLAEDSLLLDLIERACDSRQAVIAIDKEAGFAELQHPLQALDAGEVALAAIPIQDGRCIIVLCDNVTHRQPISEASAHQLFKVFANQASLAMKESLGRQERRAAQERAWQVVSFTAAHKLNNYLPFTENALRDALSRLRDQPDVAERLQHALDDVRRCKNVVSDFKRLAVPLHRNLTRPVPLPRALESIVAKLCLGTGNDVLRWDVGERAGQAFLCLDQAKMEHVFRNLIRNALDAGGEAVQIRLCADLATSAEVREHALAPERQWARLLVEDNGPGVPDRRKEEMFRPFVTYAPGGTGLGLALVRRVIESHGGRVDECGREGQGACFRIFLPLAESECSYDDEATQNGLID